MATAYVQPVDQNGQPIVQQPVVVQQGMVMQQPPQQQQQQQYVQQAQPQMQQMERGQVVAVGAHPDWRNTKGNRNGKICVTFNLQNSNKGMYFGKLCLEVVQQTPTCYRIESI